MDNVKLILGDNIESLRELPDNFVDSIVTDPPYGLSFMNKKWDYDVPSVDFWKEVYRVLKPGGHILSFGGTRTYHRMVVNIEDAGFEIRDQIMWVYGSGFPKSLNIGKGIDKLNGKDVPTGKRFNVSGQEQGGLNQNKELRSDNPNYVKPKYDNEYDGWGTGLKPANEPIVLARKPLSEKTIVENVLRWGTGGINVDGCRIGYEENDKTKNIVNYNYNLKDKQSGVMCDSYDGETKPSTGHKEKIMVFNDEGRFPANFIIDEEASRLLNEQSGESKSTGGKGEATKKSLDRTDIGYGFKRIDVASGLGGYGDKGGASRFFYVPKVSKKERNMGLDNFDEKLGIRTNAPRNSEEEKNTPQKNNHPTVKPINLLTYLVRLVTPPNGVVMDCYMGSGSTGIATLLEGFQFIGMEMDEEYFEIAKSRIENWEQYKTLIKK
jgi:site-specific DNA-methyltransferase (adenine-specific)